jgi:hypothetical protein
MFADPLSVTVNAVAKSLLRRGGDLTSAVYQTADGAYKLDIRHSYGRRTRSEIRLTQTKTTTDPLVPSQNQVVSMSAIFTLDTPVQGFTTTEAQYVADALTGFLTASSGARVTQLLSGEN